MFEKKTIDALKWITGVLDSKNVPYQISGGFAAKVYGSSRPLNDIDIDIPEDKFADILPEIKDYLIYGPSHYQDGKWDLKLLTLNYHGQEIDIGGGYDLKVSNKERTKWLPISTDSSDKEIVEINGLRINLAPPEKMIEYKQHLDGEHQIQDIDAMQEYIKKNSNKS